MENYIALFRFIVEHNNSIYTYLKRRSGIEDFDFYLNLLIENNLVLLAGRRYIVIEPLYSYDLASDNCEGLLDFIRRNEIYVRVCAPGFVYWLNSQIAKSIDPYIWYLCYVISEFSDIMRSVLHTLGHRFINELCMIARAQRPDYRILLLAKKEMQEITVNGYLNKFVAMTTGKLMLRQIVDKCDIENCGNQGTYNINIYSICEQHIEMYGFYGAILKPIKYSVGDSIPFNSVLDTIYSSDMKIFREWLSIGIYDMLLKELGIERNKILERISGEGIVGHSFIDLCLKLLKNQ